MTLLRPEYAYADEGFIGGLQDLVGAREVEGFEDYESRYTSEYQPVLRDVETDPVEEVTTSDAIETVVNRANTVSWPSTDYSLLRSIVNLLGSNTSSVRNVIVVTAVALVFMWWGVRKTLDVILSAYRRGRLKL